MEINDFVACAKAWLIDYVETNTNLKNFKIIQLNVANNGVCVFSVRYSWDLNGWEKNVEKDVYVIYSPEKKTFLTADL